jgi:hypothetical protein
MEKASMNHILKEKKLKGYLIKTSPSHFSSPLEAMAVQS